MHGGKGGRAPAEAPEGTPPADLVRYTAEARRREDGEDMGSGTGRGNGGERRDARDSKLVASADPEGGAGTASPADAPPTPDKDQRPEGDRKTDTQGESAGQVDHHGSRPEHPSPRRRRRRRRRRDGRDTGGTRDTRGGRPEAKS